MKASQIRDMTDEELQAALRTARDERFRFRLQHHTGQVDNTAQLVEAKKTVARLLTIAAERKSRAEAAQ